MVWLLRGNHEDRKMNEKYGCSTGLDLSVGRRLHLCFSSNLRKFGYSIVYAEEGIVLKILFDEQPSCKNGRLCTIRCGVE